MAGDEGPGVLTWWRGEHRVVVHPLAVGLTGRRSPRLERLGAALFRRAPANTTLPEPQSQDLLHEHVEPQLERDLQHRGIVPESGSYAAALIGWIEVHPGPAQGSV